MSNGFTPTQTTITRRRFATQCKESILRWAPWLSLFGFQFHRYKYPALVGWRGWLTWCGKTVGFVRLNGIIRWWP